MAKDKRNPRVAPVEQTSAHNAFSANGAHSLLVALVLLAAVWIVFGRSLNGPLIFDDENSIVRNDSIRQLWPLVGTADEPGPLRPDPYTPVTARPVVNLSLAVNYYFGALSPWGYRFVNVMVHWFSACLLAAIVRRTLLLPYFGGRYDRAAGSLGLMAALVWAVHPLATDAVVYVTQRTELFVAFFYLATLYASQRYWAAGDRDEGTSIAETHSLSDVRRQRAVWLAVAAIACAAGMASKQVMASAPVMVLLYERTFVAGTLRKALRGSWPLYVGLVSAWVVLLYLNWNNPHSDSAGFHLGVPATAWWFTQAKVLLMYLKLAMWPAPLLIHYEIPYIHVPLVAAPYFAAVAILAVGSLWLLWRGNAVGYVGAWVFAVLAPTLVVPITTEVAAERRMYLPLAALVTLAVVGAYRLAEWAVGREGRGARRTVGGLNPLAALAVPALLVTVLLGRVSAERVKVFADPIVLWQQTVDLQPESALAQQNLGTSLFNAGRLPEAMERFREALRLKPDLPTAHYDLALAAMQLHQYDEAIAHFRELVRLKPKSEVMRNNLAVALLNAGRLDEAIVQFRATLGMEPNMWEAHDNLGNALKRAGKLPESAEHYERALAIKPAALEVYAHLADTYARTNQPEKAIATAERAMELARSSGNMRVAESIAAQLAAFRAGQQEEGNERPAEP